MKDGIQSKLIDRRFVLGVAVGGSAVALLKFLKWPETGDTKSGDIVKHLRSQLISDPELQEFSGFATEALRQHSDTWSEAPISISKLTTLSVNEIRDLVRDDYKNNRTVTVLGWIISRTEAVLLTLI